MTKRLMTNDQLPQFTIDLKGSTRWHPPPFSKTEDGALARRFYTEHDATSAGDLTVINSPGQRYVDLLLKFARAFHALFAWTNSSILGAKNMAAPRFADRVYCIWPLH